MKKLYLLCILAFACASLIFADSTYVASGGTWIWPLGADESGQPVGEVVIRPGNVENPVYGNVFANRDYYISAEEGTPVYAPVDGIVDFMSIGIELPDGIYSRSWEIYEDGNILEWVERLGSVFFENLKKEHSLFTPENISKQVAIQMNDGDRLYLGGFLDISVKVGQKVTKGRQIGTLGYNPTFYKDPSINLSFDTELGTYLLGEDNSRFFDDFFSTLGIPLDFSYRPEKMLTKEEFTEAWDIFKITLLEDHPALINPLIAAKVQQKVAEIDIRLSNMKTVRVHDFRLFAEEVLAVAHCLHTVIMPTDSDYRFPISPLQLVLDEGQCFVVWDRRGNNEIPTGTEVFAVNGMPIKELTQKLASFISTDTINPEVAQRQMEYGFTTFLQMYFLNDSYSFTLKDRVVALPILSPEQVVFNPAWVATEKKSPYEQLDKDTAVLRIERSMNHLADREPWIAYFKEIFENGTKNLILDLRGNGGGGRQDISFLLSYFLDQPFQLDEYDEIKHGGVYNSAKYSDMGYNPNAEYPLMLAKFQNSTDGAYKFMNKEFFEPAKAYGFKGNLYVLVDTFSASGGVSVASILAENGATTIGSETRGGYYSTNAHTFTTVYLGETNLKLYMPLTRVVFTTDESNGNLDWPTNPPNRGLIPQHIVYKTLDETLSNTGSDRQLNYTLELIKDIERVKINELIKAQELIKSQKQRRIVLIVLAVVLVVGILVAVLVIKKRRKA